MRTNEPFSLRVIIIGLNCLTLFVSTCVLIAFRRLPRLQETSGFLLSLATILETLFSLTLLGSQFYSEDDPVPDVAVYQAQNSYFCQLTGATYITILVFFLFVVNIYVYYMGEIIRAKFLMKTKNIQVQSKKVYLFVLASILTSITVASLSYVDGDIGYNAFGICGNSFYFVTTLDWVILSSVLITFLITSIAMFKLLKIEKNQMNNSVETDAARFQNNFQQQFIQINFLYLLVFNVTRIVPILILSIIQTTSTLQNKQNNGGIQTLLLYTLTCVISLGGFLLSLLRCKEPIVFKQIQKLLPCFAIRTDPNLQRTNTIQFRKQTQTKQQLANRSFSTTSVIDEIQLSDLKEIGTDNLLRHGDSVLRKTQMNQRLTSPLSFIQKYKTPITSFDAVDEFQWIFLMLYHINSEYFRKNRTVKQIEHINKLRSFDFRFIMQKKFIYNSDVLISERIKRISQNKEENVIENIQECFQPIDTYARVDNDNVMICTGYAEPVFISIRDKLNVKQSQIEESLNPISNSKLLDDLYLNQLHQQLFTFLTSNADLQFSFISRKGKTFLLNAFLKELLKTQQNIIFITPIIGLYSFTFAGKNNKTFNMVMQKPLINVREFSQQYSCQVVGIYTFQNSEITINLSTQLDQSDKTQAELWLVSQLKLKEISSNAFYENMEIFLYFMKQNQLWGYSFNLIFFKSEEENVASIDDLNNQGAFQTVDNGYIIPYAGNIFDQFLLRDEVLQDQNYASTINPEIYALSLIENLHDILDK